MFVNCVIHSFLCCLIFPSVNSDENSEDDYIEFTLLLHCKLETKKNARAIDFSGVFEFLFEINGDYIPIPPIPPMPPIPPGIPAGIPPPASFSSGLSAIIASVVTNNPEIEAAS